MILTIVRPCVVTWVFTKLATHLLAFEDAGWERTLTDRTWNSLTSVTMAGWLSTEAVTFHYSSETTTLGSADNRYEFAFAEDAVIKLFGQP